MVAVKCEDSYQGCPECSHMKYDARIPAALLQIPRCSICHSANGLRRIEDGKYVCYGPHAFEDS
jgi:acetyl-CoA carboxylase beta subunit